MEGKEYRITVRFYSNNPTDADTLQKLDRLVSEGKFRTRNDVLRRGVRLAYSECYDEPDKTKPHKKKKKK